MKKVLYVSNIEVPYRVKMFNELSKHCDLTVLYERKKSDSRDEKWSESEKPVYNVEYLNGRKIGAENSFSFKLLKKVFEGYDSVIIGCYNSPVQMMMILLLRILNKPYILNLDGEVFADKNGFKSFLKKLFLKGADRYLVAGNESAKSLRKIVGDKKVIIPYYFSSLSKNELQKNSLNNCEREDFILVVGQYLDVKGLDVALSAARINETIRFKFIGMGDKTDLFIKKYCSAIQPNVEFIPFLQKEELEKEYRKCAVFVLPSRQECWGLVINEAASFGTPIVSTWGSGAAIEFLSDNYPEFLAEPGNAESLYKCIKKLLDSNSNEYSRYLLDKSQGYCIENCVLSHLDALNICRVM